MGSLQDLKRFLAPMKKSGFDHARSLFLLDKQIFLELLEAQTRPTTDGGGVAEAVSSEKLVEVLKDLEGRCSQEEFHGLCFCLTVKSLSQHPEYKAWTVYGGRSALFDSLLKHLSAVFPDQVERKGRAKDTPDNHLVKLCQLAVMQQIQEHKYHNPNARIPEDFFASILGEVRLEAGQIHVSSHTMNLTVCIITRSLALSGVHLEEKRGHSCAG